MVMRILFAFLFISIGPLRTLMSNFTVQMISIPPADGIHKRIDVCRRFGAEIHVIGMLVHIERQNRRSACQGMAMVRGPLIDQLAIAWRPRQQYPARAAAECLAHRHELGTPAFKGSEIAGNRIAEGSTWLGFDRPVRQRTARAGSSNSSRSTARA